MAWVGMKFGHECCIWKCKIFFCFAVTQIPANEIAITATLSQYSVFKMYTWQLLYLISELPYIVNLYIILGTVCFVHFVT